MFIGRRTKRHSGRRYRTVHRLAPWFCGIALLMGCSQQSDEAASRESLHELEWTQNAPAASPNDDQPSSTQTTNEPLQLTAAESPYWAFPSDEYDAMASSPPPLIRLPLVADKQQTSELPSLGHPVECGVTPKPLTPTAKRPVTKRPAAVAPQVPSAEPRLIAARPVPPKGVREPQAKPLPVLDELTQQQQALEELLRDASSAVTGVLTNERVNQLAKQKIQHAYAMANRGALYVARQELIEVLRVVSQEKDALQGTPERSVALAAGLRALREANDFAPQGTQLEAELDIRVLCASHRTPVAHQPESAELLPRLMMDRYFRYAQLQLALSVAGEPAGSMALHALGKIVRQLGQVEPDEHPLADRLAIAYQQAALLAHNQNYLAAHELGVLFARCGHFREAQHLLQQVAAREPNAIVYRNLALVQQELGLVQASATLQQADQLQRQGAVGTANVQWVAPTQFSHAKPPTAATSLARRSTTEQLVVPGTRRPAAQPIRR